MWTPELPRDGTPIYQAIADAIDADARSGRLAPGARLPPQRILADRLGVDFTTVTRAYAEARRRGLISSRVGRGTFVAAGDSAADHGLPSGGLVDMSMNLPPRFEDPELSRRLWRSVAEVEADQGLSLMLRYQEAAGAPADRAAGAEWLRDRLPQLSPERVMVSAGAQPALAAILGGLARPGEAICAEALTYPGLRSAAAQLGVSILGVPTDAEGMTPAGLDQVCRERGPKAIYCTPTLQNPTTATMSLARRRAIVEVARRRRVPILEDDAYGKLPASSPPPLAALAPEMTYHVAGLAKVVSPALRIAYVVAPDAAAQSRVAAALRAFSGMASPLTAALATRWIRTGLAGRALAAIRAEAEARRRLAGRILGSAAASPPDAFHLWLELPRPWSRAAFQAALLRRGVSVVPSDAFAVTAWAPEAVRVGLGAAAGRSETERALSAIAEIAGTSPAAPAVV